jgi:hypothetical protein
MSLQTRLVGTISNSDGSNPVSFTIPITQKIRYNLSAPLNGYKLTANVQQNSGGVWSNCTSISGTGVANLGYNHELSQFVPEVGTTARYVNFDYCKDPMDKPTFLVAGANYDENIFLYASTGVGATKTWQVSPNATTWYNISPVPRTGAPYGFYFAVDRPMLRGVLGSTFYGKPLYFRCTVTSVCSAVTSDPSVSVQLYALKPDISITGAQDVACKGESTGIATLTIAHLDVDRFVVTCYNLDNAAYDFQVPVANRGANQITGLRAGNWQFKVENNNSVNPSNYGAAPATIGHVVGEPSAILSATLTPKKYGAYDLRCVGSGDGELTASAAGGNGGYSYTWAHDASLTGATISGLGATTYTVTVHDQKGCAAQKGLLLTEPTAVTASAVSTGGKNGYGVSCWDKSDGAAQVAAAGGAGGYTYLWSTNGTGDKISGLGVNTYGVTATDANGCPATTSVTLGAPPKIDFAIHQLTTLVCAGDHTASLEATPVTTTIIGRAYYNWASGEQTAAINNVPAGTYSLTVSDDQGCSTQKSVTIADPKGSTVSLAAQANYNGAFIRCNNEANGTIDATVRDENGVVTTVQNYAWTNNDANVGEGATLAQLRNAEAGNYKVVITYNNRCTAEATYSLVAPAAIIPDITAQSNYNGQVIRCTDSEDGRIRAAAIGGTGALSYTWNTGVTGAQLINIGAGTYTVTTRDVNNCAGTASLVIDKPDPVIAEIASASDFSGYGVSCNGLTDGSITAAGDGGTGTYTYAWSNSRTTAAITGLGVGTYTVVISDNNGCQATAEHTINQPTALQLSPADKKNVSCFGGTDGAVTLTASGGVTPYEFSRDNISWGTASTLGGFPQGTFQVRARDKNNCPVILPQTFTQPPQLQIQFKDKASAFCANAVGTATAVVSGGVGNYQYAWYVDGQSTIIQTSSILSHVAAGIYRLDIHDGNNCPAEDTVVITSTDGAKMIYTAVDTECFDSSDGSVQMSITAGQGPFTIQWPDGQSALQGVSLRKGIYNVAITDAHACTVIEPVEVKGPEAIDVDVQSERLPTCYEACDGGITLVAVGGIGGYTYAWNNTTGATQNQLCAGNYAVTTKDANGCEFVKTIVLAQPEPIAVQTTTYTLATCKDGCDGSIVAGATGGNGGYQYQWAMGGDGDAKSNLCPGTYDIAVLDNKGCRGTGSVVLPNTPMLPVDLGGGIILCAGQDYALSVDETWKTIQWGSNTGFVSTDPTVTIQDPGSYWVEVINEKGCVAQDTFLLETSLDLLEAQFMITSEAVVGDTVVMIEISWPTPETIAWAFPPEMKALEDLGDVIFGQFEQTGTYEVSLTAQLGKCVDVMTKEIVILDRQPDEEDGRLGYEDFVQQFTVYPNPNDGNFDVSVQLMRESPIVLSVWNSATSILVGNVHADGSNQYLEHIDLRPLAPGAYVLRLDFETGKRYIRFVVR